MLVGIKSSKIDLAVVPSEFADFDSDSGQKSKKSRTIPERITELHKQSAQILNDICHFVWMRPQNLVAKFQGSDALELRPKVLGQNGRRSHNKLKFFDSRGLEMSDFDAKEFVRQAHVHPCLRQNEPDDQERAKAWIRTYCDAVIANLNPILGKEESVSAITQDRPRFISTCAARYFSTLIDESIEDRPTYCVRRVNENEILKTIWEQHISFNQSLTTEGFLKPKVLASKRASSEVATDKPKRAKTRESTAPRASEMAGITGEETKVAENDNQDDNQTDKSSYEELDE